MVAVALAVPSLIGLLAQKQVAERGSKEEKEHSHKEREEKCSIRWLSNRSRQCSRNGSGGNIGGDI